MFLGKQNDLICLIADDRQKLVNSGIEFTAIEETDENYVFNGENYVIERDYLSVLKEQKHSENSQKAKEYIENGYVVYKNAEFETNTDTSDNLNNKRQLCIIRGDTSTLWLSKDDKNVEMQIDTENPIVNDDFVKLAFLIEDFKNDVWKNTYMSYKNLIDNAQTVEQLQNIEINYERGINDN